MNKNKLFNALFGLRPLNVIVKTSPEFVNAILLKSSYVSGQFKCCKGNFKQKKAWVLSCVETWEYVWELCIVTFSESICQTSSS